MARMMDSLIMDNFPPYTYTKITTHRPSRIGTTIKKSATVTNLPHTASGTRLNMQKNKIPMQGKIEDAPGYEQVSNVLIETRLTGGVALIQKIACKETIKMTKISS